MTIPLIMTELPQLVLFIQHAKAEYDAGHFTNWTAFSQAVRAWYTPERLQAIDQVVMGWEKMASYNDQQTLVHVTASWVMLLGLSEYHALSEEDQNLAVWSVLYHAVDKIPSETEPDLTYAFRSAATCGAGMMGLEWVDAVEPLRLYMWHGTLTNARMFSPMHREYIQDNGKLTDIMQGVDDLFDGRDSPAGLMICAVLFHMSIAVTDAWAFAAPLSDDEIQHYISPRLFPLLQVLILANNLAGWLFDADRQASEQQVLRQSLAHVKARIDHQITSF